MVHKYVWWDDVTQRQRSRIDVRVPKPLAEFLGEVAKKNGVSLNGLVVGILAWAAEADEHRRLKIDVVNAVRVTESNPAADPVGIPVPAATPSYRKRYGLPNVL